MFRATPPGNGGGATWMDDTVRAGWSGMNSVAQNCSHVPTCENRLNDKSKPTASPRARTARNKPNQTHSKPTKNALGRPRSRFCVARDDAPLTKQTHRRCFAEAGF